MESKAAAAASQRSRPKFMSCDAHLQPVIHQTKSWLFSEQPVIHQSNSQPATDVGG